MEAEELVRRVSDALPQLTKRTQRRSTLRHRLIKTSADSFQKTGSYSTAWSVVDEVLEINAALVQNSADEKKIAESITALLPWEDYQLPLDFEGTETSGVFIGSLP